jgi:hypothetical protein
MILCAALFIEGAAHAHKIIIKPPPSIYTWTIDPGPPINADKIEPHILWFRDGQWAVLTTWSDGQSSVWAMNTADGTTHMLAKGALAQSVSPDGIRIAIATAEGLHVIPFREFSAISAPPKPIPWPALDSTTSQRDDYVNPLVSWLDNETLISLQRRMTTLDEGFEFPADFCHTIPLSSPTSPKPFICPEGVMSHLYEILPGPDHRALLMSAAEGCNEAQAVKLNPIGTPHNVLPLPTFNLFPLGQLSATFSNAGDLLLISPCDLDHINPSLTCSHIQDIGTPAHLFLWSTLLERPKRLYSSLPPDSRSDGEARKIAWGVRGAVCVANLDPPSARQCWPTP